MSMTRQLIGALIAARREIDMQITRLNGFSSSIDRTISKVDATLAGSTQGYDRDMNAALQQTKNEIKSSIQRLEQAKEIIDRVSQI